MGNRHLAALDAAAPDPVADAFVWPDGKRRVVVARETRFSTGKQMLQFSAGQVVADPLLIKLLETHGVALDDAATPGGRARAEEEQRQLAERRHANVTALASELGILPELLRDALEGPSSPETAWPRLRAALAEARRVKPPMPVVSTRVDGGLTLQRGPAPSSEVLAGSDEFAARVLRDNRAKGNS